MKIAISVESVHDLGEQLVNEKDIKVIPYNIVMDGKEFSSADITNEQIFEFVEQKKMLVKTTALNEFEYTEYFEKLLKDYDAIVHICLSSGLTSSCNNCIRASKNFDNVYAIDSLTVSSGIGLLALYAKELADKGYTACEIAEKLEKRKNAVQTSFVIEGLETLFKGGRCNALQLFGANLFKFRPRLVSKEGKLVPDKKYRGLMPSVISKYCQETLQEYNNPDLTYAFIPHSSATPEMLKTARDALTQAGFKNIYEAKACSTITAHCGPNTLGIVYINDGGVE